MRYLAIILALILVASCLHAQTPTPTLPPFRDTSRIYGNIKIQPGAAVPTPTPYFEVIKADGTPQITVSESGVTINDLSGLGSSTVAGPGSSTDNAVVRWNGVDGEILQNSSVTISDGGDLVVPRHTYLNDMVQCGEQDTTACAFYLFGNATTTGPYIILDNAGGEGDTVEYWWLSPDGTTFNLGPNTDTDLYEFGLASGSGFQIKCGKAELGVADTTSASFLLYGDNSTQGAIQRWYNSANEDGTVDYFQGEANGTVYNFGPNTDPDQFRFSTTALEIIGDVTATGPNIYFGIEDTSTCDVRLYGNSGEGRPLLELQNPADLDGVVNAWRFQPNGTTFNLGPSTNLTQFGFKTSGLEINGNLKTSSYAEFGAETATAASAGNLVAGWHLDEAAGTLDNFEGTAGYDMESVNTPTYDVAAVFDTGLTFASASSECATVASDLGLTGWPITISGWFKTSTFGSSMSIFSLNDISEGNITYTLQVRSTGTVTMLRRNTTAYYTHGGSYVADGEWHHAVAVMSASNSCQVYVDGVLEGVSADAVAFAAGVDTASIGANNDSAPDSYFNGTIDEVVIYGAALTAAQIKAFYANGMSTRIEDGAVSTQIVDASRVEAISIIATDDIVQKYNTGYTRPVPAMEDSVRYPHQVIYYGTCTDGSITYTSDGFEEAFASGCTPIVTLTVIQNTDTADYLDAAYSKTSTNTGFTYEVRTWDSGLTAFQDTTASRTVHWQAMGWID